MRNKYNALANLYDLIQNAEEELGLRGLTEKDKLVLKKIIQHVDENNNLKITYKQIKEDLCTKDINLSKAQFFKSLSTLINKKIIFKIGSKRSSSFKFLGIINN
jgi:hypothetical protein